MGGGSGARAADWYTGAPAPEERDAWIVAVDGYATVGPGQSRFSGGTVTAAPQGDLLASGPRLRFDGMLGSYRTAGGGRGDQAEVSALAGYAFVAPDAVLSAYVGLNLRSNGLANVAAGTVADSTTLGVKTVLDLYARPTPATMIHATGSYASAFNAYYGRLRGGFSAFAGGYVGPEFALLGDDNYRQWRAGLHLSGLQLGPMQLGIAAGYARDAARKGGLYTTLDLRSGF